MMIHQVACCEDRTAGKFAKYMKMAVEQPSKKGKGVGG
jgi:hypothetical protein